MIMKGRPQRGDSGMMITAVQSVCSQYGGLKANSLYVGTWLPCTANGQLKLISMSEVESGSPLARTRTAVRNKTTT